VTLYDVPTKDLLFDDGLSPIVDGLFVRELATFSLADNAEQLTVSTSPVGWLLIKAVPTSPGSANDDRWILAVQRSG
jgi:hypothetical protein